MQQIIAPPGGNWLLPVPPGAAGDPSIHIAWGRLGYRLLCPGGASSFLSLNLMPGPPASGFDPILASSLPVIAHDMWKAFDKHQVCSFRSVRFLDFLPMANASGSDVLWLHALLFRVILCVHSKVYY